MEDKQKEYHLIAFYFLTNPRVSYQRGAGERYWSLGLELTGLRFYFYIYFYPNEKKLCGTVAFLGLTYNYHLNLGVS